MKKKKIRNPKQKLIIIWKTVDNSKCKKPNTIFPLMKGFYTKTKETAKTILDKRVVHNHELKCLNIASAVFFDHQGIKNNIKLPAYKA